MRHLHLHISARNYNRTLIGFEREFIQLKLYYRHQRQALTFFLRREQGLHPTEDSVGLWAPQTDGLGSVFEALYVFSEILTGPCLSFTNIITNQTQLDPGPLWRGGLLADEMGLGKTLSMIALIASDYAPDNRNSSLVGRDPTEDVCSTLVVLPLSRKISFLIATLQD